MGGRLGHLDSYLGSSQEQRTVSYETLGKGGDNIVVVRGKNDENRSAPIFSNTPNRVYVNVNRKTNAMESVTIYKNHVEEVSIHPGLDGSHGGLHVHSPRVKNEKRNFVKLTSEYKAIFNKASIVYNNWRKNNEK